MSKADARAPAFLFSYGADTFCFNYARPIFPTFSFFIYI